MAILYFFQSHYVYFPEREIILTPDKIGLSYEPVSFAALDGPKLSGWFVPAADSRGVVLFCHGNGGNISHRLELIALLRELGLSTFIFDYRGYGQSEGKPNERGTYNDAEAAWQYLTERRQVRPDKIVVFGESLGGAVASYLARRHTPKALILQSTFTSFRDLAAKFYPYLPVRLLARFDYNTIAHLRGVRCPVLVVHSRDDEMIPFGQGRRLFEAAKEPKEFLAISGSHNEGFATSGKIYVDGLREFIAGL